MVHIPPGAALTAVVLGLLVAATGAHQQVFDFENGMESWSSYRGSWQWTNRSNLANTLPGSTEDGFVVMEEAFHSDELYTPYFDASLGINFTMRFFLRSRWVASSNMYVDLHEQGRPKENFLDLQEYATPDSDSWITVKGEVPSKTNPILLSIFCYNGEAAPAGDLLYGCAIDQIIVDVYTDHTTAATTTTTAATTTTTVATITTAVATTKVPTEVPTDATTNAPTDTPTDVPTDTPTDVPTDTPTDVPTDTPTDVPTDTPTDVPTDTPTDVSTDTPTDVPTDTPTDVPTDTPTDVPTDTPTDVPTDTPTDVSTGTPTDVPTDTPTDVSTGTPTDVPTDTPTDVPTDTPTDVPTDTPTDVPTDTPTDVPTGTPTDVPTDTPTDVPTDTPTDVSTGTPTDVSTGTPTDVSTGTPTDVPTTVGPAGPLVFDFQSSSQGWAMSLMNGAIWRRVLFESGAVSVGPPPAGPWVLQIFSLNIFSGTVLAQSPHLEAVSDTMDVTITFWMDGDIEFPSDLKIRRTHGFNNFDEAPLINLDVYGDQENHRWITYSVGLGYLTVGETFSIVLEGSLGGNQNNSVAVNKVVLEGVKVVPVESSNFFDFEDGLSGWSQGNMEGGRWTLKKWSEIDPSLQVPKPSDGENFLFVERFDIHSGVITLESPNLPVAARQRKKLHIKFWTRGSVVYPAVLRLRKKSSTGEYDALPFLNLAPYGDTDNSDWVELDTEYYIPVSEQDDGFQLVLEADLGSDLRNLVAVDDLRITTEFLGH